MKLFKKVLAVSAVLTLAFSAVPASAATSAVDFEDGNVPASIFMKVDDGGDVSALSVVDFNDSKALFVDVQDATLVPKLQFDVLALVGASNLDKVRKISFDYSVVNPTGEPAGWNGGGSGANITADGSVWYAGTEWVLEEYEKDRNSATYTLEFVKGMGYTKDATASSFLFMKWANANDMYIDNVQFLDADGNPVEIALGSDEAAADDTAAVADDTAVVADDAAAVDTAAADTTSVPKTGVVGLGLVYGLGALATGAVVLKKKEK